MRTAYHYTVALYAEAIFGSGVLRVATEVVSPPERPAVWFSTRRAYEPTAYKRIRNPDGTVRNGGYADLFTHGGGALRFGLSTDRLVAWAEHRRSGGIDPRLARGLERAARAVGSNPRDWWLSYDPVPITACTIEAQLAPHGPWAPSRFPLGGRS